MSTPRPRPTVVTSPRSEITSPLSSTRRKGVSTATLPSIGADRDISPSGHPPCHGSYTEMSSLGQTSARLEDRHHPSRSEAGPRARPGPAPGKLPCGKPGGTCMANRPANAGAYSAGPQQGMPQATPQGVPQATPRGVPQATPRGVPQATPRGVPQATPRGMPQATPQATPLGQRAAPAPTAPAHAAPAQ